jgi:hypothetical protein
MGEMTSDPSVQESIEEIGEADILVGIPSYKNADTIAHVVRMAAEGMVKHFPDMKAVLVNSDGDSPDGTRNVVLSTPTPETVDKMAFIYLGRSGKGMALKAIMEIARALNVKVCVTVDSDLRSITPEWIKRLAGPIVEKGYHFVTPYYTRHKYDATITNNLTFPMTRMLYGVEVRQPIGGDFGFSRELVESYLAKDVWDTDVGAFGIDIWMTTTAINESFKICQARMGAKIHNPKDPASSLGPMFVQVVGTLFSMMALYEDNWKKVSGVKTAPIFGEPSEEQPEPVPVTLRLMIDKFRAGSKEQGKIWQTILAPENLAAVEEIAGLTYERYEFPAEVWAKIVIDFAVAYSQAPGDPDDTVLAMTPLYYGRAGSMAKQMQEMSAEEAEEVIRGQARVFEDLKPCLIERWNVA